VAVILNQHSNLVFGLSCHGWLAAVGPVNFVLFTFLKMPDPASEITYMASSPYTLLRRI
jgi:hypothetical protein